MDYQNRPGAKTGSGGVASWSETNRDRRERLRQLALETIDLTKDPYFMKNHLGSYECKLCLTIHNNEGSYLAHTQGKKHQANLARRAAKEAKDNLAQQQMQPNQVLVDPMKFNANLTAKKKFVKIGRPGYKVTKQKDAETSQCSLLFQIDYPEIAENVAPRHRFMSAYEQRMEPPDKKWQYLLFAAEPYETIAFKVPSREIDKPAAGASGVNNFGTYTSGYGFLDLKGNKGPGASFVNYVDKKFWYFWNAQAKQFYLQFAFRLENAGRQPPLGLGAPNSGASNNKAPFNKNVMSDHPLLLDDGAADEQLFEGPLDGSLPPPPIPPNFLVGDSSSGEQSVLIEAPSEPGTLIDHNANENQVNETSTH